jgi:hypothetical protein
MRDVLGPIRCFVSIVNREYESWIVGGHPAFNELHPDDAANPKGRIKDFNGGRYKETADQARFTSRIDVKRLAERSPSFQRLHEFINSLV